jgi:hypothetical protein
MAYDPLWMMRRKPMHPYVEREQQKIIHEMGIGKGTWTHEQILEREREYTRRMTEAMERAETISSHSVVSTAHVPTINIEEEPEWSDEEPRSFTLDEIEHEVEEEVEHNDTHQVRDYASNA